jgi:succinyl-CoA synthetase beta subunit
MDLQEYRAKSLLAEHQIQVLNSILVEDMSTIDTQLESLNTNQVVVKAQVLSGGRGKAGGVKVVDKAQAKQVASQMLGQRLVTHQTTEDGLMINQVLIEEAVGIKQEFYLAFILDRTKKAVTLIASSEGGMDIEQVAEANPSALAHTTIYGDLYPYHVRLIADVLKIEKSMFTHLYTLVDRLYHVFLEAELTLLEINPLVITEQGDLLCLDAKMNVDENALMRLSAIASWRDYAQENPKEVEAGRYGLSYVALDGNIGCMVNGAGLAMATMDTIKLYGGEPANFLDVGGDATEERVMHAFRIIGQDPNVSAILVNIFGGIVRCDLIANGILSALEQVHIKKPIIVRLEGHNAEHGRNILNESQLNVHSFTSFTQAAQKAVALAKEG